MRATIRNMAIAVAAAVTVAGATAALPTVARASIGMVAAATGMAVASTGTAAVSTGASDLDSGSGSALALRTKDTTAVYPYAYGGGCATQRRAVINRYGHRVWRWVRVCY